MKELKTNERAVSKFMYHCKYLRVSGIGFSAKCFVAAN
jgi:hypothetical protein